MDIEQFKPKLDLYFPEANIEDETYRIVTIFPEYLAIDEQRAIDYIQHEWFYVYTEAIKKVAKKFYGKEDFVVLKFIPRVRRVNMDEIELRLDVTMMASKYEKVYIQTPIYEEWPVTFEYIWREWKNTKKNRIRKWWKELFK